MNVLECMGVSVETIIGGKTLNVSSRLARYTSDRRFEQLPRPNEGLSADNLAGTGRTSRHGMFDWSAGPEPFLASVKIQRNIIVTVIAFSLFFLSTQFADSVVSSTFLTANTLRSYPLRLSQTRCGRDARDRSSPSSRSCSGDEDDLTVCYLPRVGPDALVCD
jgi:hypothetical protein